MPNKIAAYNEIWYANKSIEQLEKLLTFAPTVDRSYEDQARRKGEIIQIKKPGTFEAEDFPSATAQDLEPEYIQLKLDGWKGVQFAIDDKELHYSGDEIIQHHIAPSMQAVADAIEQSAVSMYADVPWFVAADTAKPVNDFIGARKSLNSRHVSSRDRFGALDFNAEADYLEQELFHSVEKSSEGAITQREGYLGRKFGFETFTNANLPSHVAGTLDPDGGAIALKGAGTKGDETITIDATALTGTLKKGDSLVIAGNAQRYAVTADAAAAGNEITIGITPALAQDYADNYVVTVRTESKDVSLFYQQTAFTMVMAPLSEAGTMSAEIGVAMDDQTGLAIRFMRWYDPKGKSHWLSFDALWGVRTVDPNRAVRVER